MDEDAPPRRVFDAFGWWFRWKDQVEDALSSNVVSNWRRRSQSRSALSEALRQAKTPIMGCYGHISK